MELADETPYADVIWAVERYTRMTYDKASIVGHPRTPPIGSTDYEPLRIRIHPPHGDWFDVVLIDRAVTGFVDCYLREQPGQNAHLFEVQKSLLASAFARGRPKRHPARVP